MAEAHATMGQLGSAGGAGSEEEYSVPVEGAEMSGLGESGVDVVGGLNGRGVATPGDGEGSDEEDDEDMDDGAYGELGVDSEAATALHGMRMAAANPARSTSELSQEDKARLREKLKKKVFDAPVTESSKRKHAARALPANESEEEEKKRIRKEKNREAAARCRNKRRQTLDMLEKECTDMQGEIGQLEDQLQQVQTEIRAMEASLKDHSCLYVKA